MCSAIEAVAGWALTMIMVGAAVLLPLVMGALLWAVFHDPK